MPVHDGNKANKKLQDFSDIGEDESQTKLHKIFKERLPSTREIGEGEFVLSRIGGVIKLQTKVDGVLKSVTLT